ncbi:MAG: hypothetical protein LUG51_07175 [Tannerellaceae bacterium]|nr:hypothetical protein [Tannerellaceae bacterium]
MGKKYKYEEVKPEGMVVREPMMEYSRSDKNALLPPPTEEELKHCITGDELIEYMYDHIHNLFNGK